jgi:hypothetical protein
MLRNFRGVVPPEMAKLNQPLVFKAFSAAFFTTAQAFLLAVSRSLKYSSLFMSAARLGFGLALKTESNSYTLIL